jgi:UDP-N-acetylglucosamine--N-acetylmuramyl-(pentapeptide) pyrophosphoryl-undecaprenol N-acetylglucosamine transferase
VGGSLGAQALNQVLPQALALMAPAQRPVVLHQTGPAQLDAVRAAYSAAGLTSEVMLETTAFINDMPQQLAACDVMLCRAGAITVSELCAAGVPALLVPFIASTTAHQRDNAQWMAAQGAAVHLPQSELNAESLARTLAGLSREGLLLMAQKARALARPHAAARVADEIEKLVAAK